MSRPLIKGEKIVICKLHEPKNLVLQLSFSNPPEFFDIDLFTVMIDLENRIIKENIVFYNHTISSCHGVQYDEMTTEQGRQKQVEITLQNIPDDISRIVFIGNIFKEIGSTGAVESILLKFEALEHQLHRTVFQTIEDVDVQENNSIILGELYRYKDSWKYHAIQNICRESSFQQLKTLYGITVC
ncbi:MAG: TerD family protein [Bacillota bacterium]